MAERDELFYRPDIKAPIRERVNIPDEITAEHAVRDTILEDLGIPKEDVPDPLTAFEMRFIEYGRIAAEIRLRSEFLLDKTIEDLDLYVGDAPLHVLRLLTDLTDIHFTDSAGEPLPPTDPAYTLPADVAQCIFRVAGAYDPKGQEKPYLDDVKNFNADALKKKVTSKLQNASYLKQVMYGLKLLVIVLKMAHVISVHYTVGWVCGFFRGKLKFGINKKIMKVRLKFEWKIGDKIADQLHKIEKQLLKLVGYKCSLRSKPPHKCDHDQWRKMDFKQINCCVMEPIFFGITENDVFSFIQSSCFEKWIRQEMDPDYAGKRTICTVDNATNKNIEPNEYERVAAQEVARYLETRQSTTGTMGFGAENVRVLTKTIEAADVGTVMTDTVQSAIKNQRLYQHTGKPTAPWDCFGMQDTDNRSPEERMTVAVNKAAGQWLPKNNGTPLVGRSQFQFLEQLDNVLYEILSFADRMVCMVADLSKWGSSKQLCCFIYLIVAVASIWRALITKGVWCPDQEDGDAVREELHLRWARDLRNNKDLQEFVKLLQVLKQILDIFIGKMQRQILLAGLTLPLTEMWEMIKVTIANGLSEFLDILFGPLDQLLAGLQTIPEIRHMINNECFGFDKFLKFLLCLLGNLKWGILNSIMRVLDFTLPDIVILNDVMLTRMRLKSLEALSKLLQAVINLILNLRDCYDPEDLINKIVRREIIDEYGRAKFLVEVAGSPQNLAKFDEYSKPLLAESTTFTVEDQEMLDGLEAGMSGQFGEFGPAAKEIVSNAINAPLLSVSRFVDPITGQIVTMDQFIVMMEEMTGTKVSEIEESMRYIFDILRGQDTTNETA